MEEEEEKDQNRSDGLIELFVDEKE